MARVTRVARVARVARAVVLGCCCPISVLAPGPAGLVAGN